ncbi:MAG: phenylalanine--tRNA ligase beta subunit-related protein [Synergistaceae bacterium]
MKITIDDNILTNFPETKIGWLTVDITEVVKESEYVDRIKRQLETRMNDIGISTDTMMLHPDLLKWREVFSKMKVKPSKYRSSLEALLRRIFKGELWSVSTIVDLYDTVSAMNLLPMGAFDLDKIDGDLILRYGKSDEKFLPLGSDEEIIEVKPEHIVYADDKRICCWLWNHRDSREVALTSTTKRALFMIDSAFETEWRTVEEGLETLSLELSKIGAKELNRGISDKKTPSTDTEAKK